MKPDKIKFYYTLIEEVAQMEEDACDINLHYAYTDYVNREKLATHLQNRIWKEKGHEIKSMGWTQATENWLSGLAIDIPFNNCDILDRAQNAGICGLDGEDEDKFLSDYFGNLAKALIQYIENA